MIFPNAYIRKIYKYIQLHDGETILMQDLSTAIGASQPTTRKYLRWLIRRELVIKNGKRLSTPADN